MSNAKQGDIVTLVLNNGAEVIGKLTGETETYYKLERPRMVQANQQGVGLVNGVCVTGEEPKGDVEFNKTGVIFVIKTVEEMAKGYQQQVSGLVLPTEGLKVQMKSMKELWRKMLKSYAKGKENKAAKLEYKLLKRQLQEKNG